MFSELNFSLNNTGIEKKKPGDGLGCDSVSNMTSINCLCDFRFFVTGIVATLSTTIKTSSHSHRRLYFSQIICGIPVRYTLSKRYRT